MACTFRQTAGLPNMFQTDRSTSLSQSGLRHHLPSQRGAGQVEVEKDAEDRHRSHGKSRRRLAARSLSDILNEALSAKITGALIQVEEGKARAGREFHVETAPLEKRAQLFGRVVLPMPDMFFERRHGPARRSEE